MKWSEEEPMSRRGENIYKRRDGRWEGRYRIGFKPDQTPRYRSIYGHSYQEVKAKLTALKATPPPVRTAGTLTFGTLLEEWMGAIRIRVKPSTFANYRMKADKHILPMLGGIRYDALTAEHVHDFIRQKLENGLSAKYVADIVIVMKSVGKYGARAYGFRNPFTEVILPKTERRELQIFTQAQQTLLCRYMAKHCDLTALCILLSMYTGLRIGEVCGLKWEDVDFLQSTLTVRRTVQRIRAEHGTKLVIDSPKSRASRRVIPIPDFLMKLLRKQRSSGGFYILSNAENVMEPRTLQRRFKSVLKKANLPSLGFHSLRHLFATNSIRTGFDIKTLSEILGHACVETTLSRYVHSSMERKRECMELLRPVA